MECLFFFYSFVFFVFLGRSFSSSSVHHLCSPTEAYALLLFKQSFQISDYFSSWDSESWHYDYQRTKSWNESRDCCSWDGVTCDLLNGHVIALDLSCNLLRGSIHPNSSLFQLHHLHTLNLANNNFNHSSISHNIGRLRNLRHLNLSDAWFQGKIPTEISYLSNLVSLDLSSVYVNGLQLDERTFETMLHNFTNLELLSLHGVNISSPIPVNISSYLRYLDLGYTNLRGVLTESFFLLPNSLETLKLSGNHLLKGVFPKTHPSNTLLMELDISYTGISGELPHSIGTFSSLNILDLYGCQFSGAIPDSIGNLTQITELDLSYNHFTGHIPSTISKLKHLTYLDLFDNSLGGTIPHVFSNLQELVFLDFSNNNFTGPFPSSIFSLTSLRYLYLSHNSLSGTIHSLVLSLPSLRYLYLDHNQFSRGANEIQTNPTLETLDLNHNQLNGPFPLSLVNLTSLAFLDFSSNNITGDVGINITFPSLSALFLSSCELKDFPHFLRNVKNLSRLDLSNNKIRGQIPNWFSSMKWDSLEHLSISHNLLTGHLGEFHYHNLKYLDLKFNFLQEEEEEDGSYFLSGFMWESVVIGYSFGLVVGTVIGCFSSSFDHHLCSPTEASALLQFKQHFEITSEYVCHFRGQASFPKTKSWNESRDCCTWDGVTCDILNGHVIGLDISCSLLKGTIHPNSSLFQLHHLQTLNLAYNNSSTSSITHNIGRLTNLRNLNLSYSYFDGKIPTEISYLSNLVSLDLTPPYKYGLQLDQRTFEAMLHNLTNLEVLSLSFVNISSPIPVNISSSLRYVDLEYTNLRGQCGTSDSSHVPQPLESEEDEDESYFFSGFTWELVVLGYSFGLVVGTVMWSLIFKYRKPKWFVKFFEGIFPKKMRSQSFSSSFVQHLCSPSEALSLLQLKQHFEMSDKYSRHYSTSLPKASSWNESMDCCTWDWITCDMLTGYVIGLDLSNANLSGTIHPNSSLFQLHRLQTLNLAYNNLSGLIPDSIGNFTQIRELDFGSNHFTGHIPSTISKLKHLTRLDLSFNSLGGKIPDVFSNLQELVTLYLSYNSFIGPFPSSILNLTHLENLDLSSNSLSGPLPNNVSMLQKLVDLDFSHNLLNGTIPSWVFSLPSLYMLELHHNLFNGLSDELKVNRVVGRLDLSYNQLSSPVLQSLQNLTNLVNLDLSSNNITVDGGTQITFPRLEILRLSSCELKDFPQFLRNLKTLRVINLSNNKIRGQIPNWFSGMRWDSLFHLNLSYNSLNGHIDLSHFYSLQCGTVDPLHIPQPLEEEEDETYFFSGFTWESVVMGYSFGLVVGTIAWNLMFKAGKPKWFVEFFEGIIPHRKRRPKKRAQRRRT
ncbi:hypothetical protein H5410_059291 [Solanum commersonii]|uniref:Leucine-rich repeat-containing N-terminal plant-type domain-containing protein n=1 Tax=Solanum commersonii TaxID=4109 RepID=A0A9J5W213_SOLCO|nr:hypothetical protein H5410_059291 [Solanum commersonii]